jgi:hypothetical protein
MEVAVQALTGVNFRTTPIFLNAGPAKTAEADLIED